MKKLNSILILLAIIGLSNNTFAQWNTSGTNIYNSNSGNVGIGTTNPQTKLDVDGNLKVGNESGAEFYINETGVAHMTRQTGGYNLIIENTSTQSYLDYGAALFQAPNGVYAIKAEGRVLVTGDFILTSPDGTEYIVEVDISRIINFTCK